MIAALLISFVRLIYIFLLKENITSEEFTSYVFLISIIAICSSVLSPIDSIVSRFSRVKTEKIYLSYCLFHIYLRILIITIVSLGIYALVPLPKEIYTHTFLAIILGTSGSILINFIYATSIARSADHFIANSFLILPILIKLSIFVLFYFNNYKFNDLVFVSEISQFLTSVTIIFYYLYKIKIKDSFLNFNLNGVSFINEIKKYGYQGFLLIPVSYIKTNMAPLLASISLEANGTFYVLFFQKVFDQLRSIISRPNLLLSGLESKEQLIGKKWLVLSVITIVPAIYFQIIDFSLVFIFFFLRLSEFFIFLSVIKIHGNYLKLETFNNFNRYVFVPEFSFLIIFFILDKSFLIYIWLVLLRALMGFFSLYLFSKITLRNQLIKGV